MGVPLFAISLATAAFFCQSCTLTSYDAIHRDWDVEKASLQRNRNKIENLTVCCRTHLDPRMNRPVTAFEMEVISALKDAPFVIAQDPKLSVPLYVVILQREDPDLNISALFNILSLGLIPFYSHHKILLEVRLMDPTGKTVKRYFRQGYYYFCFGWVFLFWPPGWVSPNLVKGWILKDLTRDIVKEMYEEDYEFYLNYDL